MLTWRQVTLEELESIQVTVKHDATPEKGRSMFSYQPEKCPRVSLCLALLLKDMNSSETPFLISCAGRLRRTVLREWKHYVARPREKWGKPLLRSLATKIHHHALFLRQKNGNLELR